MSKMFLEDSIPDGESTDGMVLIYNRTSTPKTATVNGHTIGAREKAWITWGDPVLAKGVSDEFFRIIKNRYAKSDRVVVEEGQIPVPYDPVPVQPSKTNDQLPGQQSPVAPKKRKPKK